MDITHLNPENDVSTPTIVIVEDESIVALDIKRILERYGYKVQGIFPTSEALFTHLKNKRCDLILMDIKIRGSKDGIETAASVNKEYGIPSVMLTAFADDETINRVKEVGPYGYIIKPFEERELRTAIEMALVRYSLENRLFESEERYRLLFEEDLSGDFISDREGRIIDYNTAFEKLLDIDSDNNLRGELISGIFSKEEEYEKFLKNLKQYGVLKLHELQLKTSKNRQIIVLANTLAKLDDKGEIFEIIGYLIEITDRKNLEIQLRQSQKMEAVGRLAGGVAHDFNNLLTVIIGYCSMIQSEKGIEDDISRHVSGILEATKKASALTRQLLAFSRQQIMNPRIVETSNLLANLQKMLQRLLPENISLYCSCREQDAYINIDPGQLEQAIINLVVNARDAISNNGAITLSVESCVFSSIENASTGIIEPGDYICIAVRDTGSGIDSSVINHIFEPFFTTKSSDKGTGLGLAMVYGIISQSGGVIDVKSTPGKGTSVLLYIPQEKKEAQEEGHQNKVLNMDLTGDETVLLVEDDPKIRDVLKESILHNGYSLLTAANPGEAILILEKADFEDSIDIVISDFLMPYMNGIELINRIRKEIPSIKFLLMSGIPESMSHIDGNIFDKGNILLKPFSPEELLMKMRHILDT